MVRAHDWAAWTTIEAAGRIGWAAAGGCGARVVRRELMVLSSRGCAKDAALSHGHLDVGMHVLTKPFAMETLASRIKALIDG